MRYVKVGLRFISVWVISAIIIFVPIFVAGLVACEMARGIASQSMQLGVLYIIRTMVYVTPIATSTILTIHWRRCLIGDAFDEV